MLIPYVALTGVIATGLAAIVSSPNLICDNNKSDGTRAQYQQDKEIRKATVTSISHYRRSIGDIHWPVKGVEIHVKDENRVIKFNYDNWDSTVREGDTVDLIVEESLFGDMLCGTYINDYK